MGRVFRNTRFRSGDLNQQQEGTKQEKRDLLECLKSKLILRDKVLEIEK